MTDYQLLVNDGKVSPRELKIVSMKVTWLFFFAVGATTHSLVLIKFKR